ncbi:MAG: tetratricopeptide repeat protein [Phycisphaerales bacterium]
MTRSSSGPEPTSSATRALQGQHAVLIGRFATMPRAQAAALAVGAGATVVHTIEPHSATTVIVGMLGWPLMDSGRIPRTLATAERLMAEGKPIRVVSELSLREMLGLRPVAAPTPKSLDAAHVCAALGIDQSTLRRWEHRGLVQSTDGRFDFRDLVSLRTLTGLVARGIRPGLIQRSLDSLGRFLPGVHTPLAQLNILVSDRGELVAELEEALLTPSGQLEIRFDGRHAPTSDATPRSLSIVRADVRDSAAWIESGLEHEAAGDLDKAENAYRRAAALAPNDPTPQFNLGNVLLASGRLEAAAERFSQAVALDPSHATAWFNLAHVQDELGDRVSAMRYLRKSIALDPTFTDAYFNLGDVAERQGDPDTAASAWADYLRLDPASEWSDIARRRLAALRPPGASVPRRGGRAWA